MDEDQRGGGRSVGRQIDRVRRTNVALRGTGLATAPDPLSALTACIRTGDRAAARSLARDWFGAAERAATGRAASGRDRAALELLARVLGVPAGYFTDADLMRQVDGRLDLESESLDRGVTFYGTCRSVVPERRLYAIHGLLLRELKRRLGRTSQ